MITDFRLNKNSNIQVKVSDKWHNLITFTDDCPYGKYGYKIIGCNKSFNPYVFFNNEDIIKIETYLNNK